MSQPPNFAAHTPSTNAPDIWHGLKEHLTDVAEGTAGFAQKLGAEQLGRCAGLWHDLGKYNPDFQDFLQKAHRAKLAGQKPPRKKIPHAIHGAFLAKNLGCIPLGFLIAGHHAGLPNLKGDNSLDQKLKDPEHYSTYQSLLPQAIQEIPQLQDAKDLRKYFQPFGNDRISADFFLRLIFSCLIDADRLDTERFSDPEQYRLRQERAANITIDQLAQFFERKQQEFVKESASTVSDPKVNRIRAEVYQNCQSAALESPGVFRLCVPTGGGKTRSGLAFALKHAQAHGKERVIFAVPYTSIIDQTVRVYRDEIFQELGSEAVLEHHSGTQSEKKLSTEDQEQLEADENTQRIQEQAKLATQNWNAPLIVTTTVQLFESLLSHRPKQCRKLHNIVNSVIVLDEVQTLPIGMLSPILSVLKELVDRYRVTVVLCTATQPALEGSTPYFKDGFPEDSVRNIIPEQQAIDHFKDLKRVEYEVPDEAWTWEKLVQDMELATSSLVVLNTRRDAIAVLNALDVTNGYNTEPIEPRVTKSLEKSEVLHLSTLLCGKHRQVVLEEVRHRLKTGKSCRLVSTQVVEAGVDLDFPVVYRAMGPLDRIVQAGGRCNRNGTLKDEQDRRSLGRVVIFEPEEGSKAPPGEYSKATQKARELLQEPSFTEAQLHQPEIFQKYFQTLYPLIANAEGGLDDKGIQALRQDWSFREVGEKFKLIDQGTTPIVILYDEAIQSRLAEIAQRGINSSDRAFLQPYMINLPTRIFDKLDDKREVQPGLDLWKWTGNYDPIRGFPLEKADRDIVMDPMFLML